MKNKEIKTLSDFIMSCSEIERKDNHTLFFRGHSNSEYTAFPTVFRHRNNDPSNDRYVVEEELLFHNIITQCPDDFLHCGSTFDYLVKMQHYDLPTRLLDITSNPLVALYFACSSHIPKKTKDSSAKDAEVLIYQVPDKEIKYYNSDTVSVLSNLSRINKNFNFFNDVDNRRLVHFIQSEKPYFQNNIEASNLNTVLCVKPKLDNRRIIKQSGAFFLFGMGRQKTDQVSIPDKYRPDNLKNISISKKHKASLMIELSSVAISQATLFPEIDNVARFLRS